MTDLDTRTLNVPGATLRYDIRGDLDHGATEHPVLLMAGCPMDASGFATLATYFADRPVVTYDPRGTGRSVRTDNTTEIAPEEHAEDLHQLIDALGVGAVDLFASSGGAVNGLALVTRHPEQVRTFVGHEPPLLDVLPDRAQALAANEDIYATYQRSGTGPAMAKFIAVTSYIGPLPETYADLPDPNPAEFGLSTADDGSREDPLLGQNIRRCAGYQPDLDALVRASTRIVIAAGKESEGQLTARASATLAKLLGTELAVFPSHHAGFLGGEFGTYGDPEEFATALHQALSIR
ncbi:MAG TPA: alpha/beta hydrolase [Jiangellaceae bacterium]|nr:alpha/beta hydrolase [Jiangellaceae bacterium]